MALIVASKDVSNEELLADYNFVGIPDI